LILQLLPGIDRIMDQIQALLVGVILSRQVDNLLDQVQSASVERSLLDYSLF
jgi:hypothetical protein